MIVGIGHVARTGKDTAADALVRDLGFTRMGFADQLKELALKANPLVQTGIQRVNVQIGHGRLDHTVRGLGWERAKDLYPEVRTFLENLGKGAREVFGDDFWVRQLVERSSAGGDIVVPDVRYTNEAEAIHDAGGVVIKVVRPGVNAEPSVRPSERELMTYTGWDCVIENRTTVADLQAAVLAYVRPLMPREVAA